jgi:hypothetical protein
MHMKSPALAAKWDKETPKGKLPKRLKPKKKKA